MNFLLSLIFLGFSFFHYWLLGTSLQKWAKTPFNTATVILSGFFCNFFLSFCVGCPAQLFGWSWTFYFWSLFIVIVIIDIATITFLKAEIRNCIHSLIEVLKEEKYLQWFSSNWVLVVLFLLFFIQSLTNQRTFYLAGYDDFYYIGKVVNNIQAPMLGRENYFNGVMLDLGESIPLERILNTYEISYSFWSELFHIEPAYFCRVAMTANNYILFLMLYKEFCTKFVPRKYSQYCLSVLVIFLLPTGYLQNYLPELLKINFYDSWQFQNSFFYGGAVVRVFSLPFLFLVSLPLLKKLDIRQILTIAVYSISLVSLSTIFIQLFCVYAFVILAIKQIILFFSGMRNKNKFQLVGSTLGFILLLAFVYGINRIASTFFNQQMIETWNSFSPFIPTWYTGHLYLTYGWISLLGLLFLSTKVSGKIGGLYLTGLYSFIFQFRLFPFLSITSIFVFFVIQRTVSSIQLLILLAYGIVLIALLCRLKAKIAFCNCLSLAGIIMTGYLFFCNIPLFNSIEYPGSGTSPFGWDVTRVIPIETHMLPSPIYEIGEYFNELPYGNYRLLLPASIPDGEFSSDHANILMASNRIETVLRDHPDGLTDEQLNTMLNYLGGDIELSESVLPMLEEFKINYVLSISPEVTEDLESNGFQSILSGNSLHGSYYDLLSRK